MRRRALASGAALLVTVIAGSASPASAQDTATRADRSALTIVAGAGGVFAGSQGGVDRNTGSVVFGGIEIRQPRWSGVAGRLALRVEGDFTSQGLSSSGGFVGGDVQAVHGAALLSAVLLARGRLESYVLAGPTWSRVSTKFVFDAPTNQTPGAGFEQTTHETVPGIVLGVGAGWRVRSVAVRVETRWMSLATTESTSMVPVIVSVAVPLHR